MDHWQQFLLRLANTRLQEWDCTQCEALLSAYVDAVLDQGDDARFDLIRAHMLQCAVCKQEYSALQELATLEKSGFLSIPDRQKFLLQAR